MNADNDHETNVTPFPHPSRDKLMLLCECGCETFNLIANGTMECAYCDKVVGGNSERWIERMPLPNHDSPVEESDDFVRNSYMRTVEFARKKIVKTITHWSDTKQLMMTVGYNAEGDGRLWVDISTEEQREWALVKLEALKEYVARVALEGGPIEVVYTAVPETDEGKEDGEKQERMQEAEQELFAQDGAEESPADAEQGGTGSTGDAPAS